MHHLKNGLYYRYYRKESYDLLLLVVISLFGGSKSIMDCHNILKYFILFGDFPS